MRAISS
jgi:hypothetical protein